MRFLCARHVLSLIKMSCFSVFFRTLSKNTKNRRGSGGGGGGKKDVLFFEHPCFSRVFAKKKVHFLQFRGFPGEGLGISGYYARFCESHFSVVVRQRRKELMFELFENSSNSLVESDTFRQEDDEICHIPVEVSKKYGMSCQGEYKVCRLLSKISNKSDVVRQEAGKVCQISTEVSKKADVYR